MASLKFTIESDDEVEAEDFSDSDLESEEEQISFHFDDGMSVGKRSRETKKVVKVVQEEETDGVVTDTIRNMPHAEERAIRAQEKAKKKPKDATPSAQEVGMDEETEAAYFDSVIEDESGAASNGTMFSELNLSRSLLRAVEASGYVNPTPIQAQVIPFALAGRDICASAVTGSGKTAAFALPFLERLLFRPRDIAATRVLIVTPTRELASQIHSVVQKLSMHTDITCILISGGKKDVRSQEAALRNRPDVIICTPGRIIDHLRNSRSVTLDDLDVLVLDEVDRLLDLGFREELEEIVKYCPINRQTMLFSATMTSGVDDLVKLSLKRPIRIKTQGDATTVAPKLIQEFVRVRRDDEREAMLASLICRNFKTRVIVFFETKKEAHRFFVLLTLLESSLPVCELHGDMTQPQRETALQRFIRGDCEILIATDIAARGLDISNIQTVINGEMPRSTSTYVHRVGRTARAGKHGRAVTLVSDSRRKVMKDLLKSDAGTAGNGVDGTNGLAVLSRTIPSAVISHFTSKIAGLETEIAHHLLNESIKTQTDTLMREVERTENLMLHEDEIKSRPARTWYQTETQKQTLKEASRKRAQEESEAAREGVTVTELTALQKAQQMARYDDYREEEDSKSTKSGHRLSRKKKRRLDALKDLEENDQDAKASAKRKKTSQRDAELSQREKAGADLGKQRKMKKSDTDAKIFRPVIAVGGLDQDMRDWSGGGSGGKSLRKALKKDAAENKFTEFDAAKKLRKGGKVGHQAFKSKGRFKRR